MAAAANEIYQGADWLTYRWYVAQAFYTLDRIHNLCICRSRDQFSDLSHQIRGIDDGDILAGMADLCDDLTAELSFAEADIQPAIKSSLPLLWAAVEMWEYVCEIKKITSQYYKIENQNSFEATALLVLRIKENLKKLDQ